MKKMLSLILILSIFLIGCNKTDETPSLELKYDEEYYKVKSPYKSSVSNNYTVNNISNNDLEEVENMLMHFSKEYYKMNNSLYQIGQYLTEDRLQKLLSTNKLNKAKTIKVDKKTIKPKYISYIHEQNYYSTNNTLKGLSLAIVLNPYQEYENKYGSTNYYQVDEKVVLEHGKQKAEELITYIRDNFKIKERILVGLYIANSPSSITPGSFKYIGITNNNDISFKKTNNSYQYLDSSYVSKHDTNSFNAFKNLNTTITNKFKTTYLSALGLYIEGRLNSLEINVTCNYLNRSDLLYLSELISEQIGKLFNSDINLKVYIKINKQLKTLIVKPRDTLKTNIYMMKG